MSPRTISRHALHHPEPLHVDDTVEQAARRLLDAELPALPVVDARERYVGILGEREVMAALFPGYVSQLRHAGFLSRSLDEWLELRERCRSEPVGQHMTTEHVDVGPDFSDTAVAEIFLHHRVLVVPVVAAGRLEGVLTRHDFFRALAERLASPG